jgi:phosphoenolpyruvate-protein kinase (PTS system EI component)
MKFKVSFSGEHPEKKFAEQFSGVGLIRGEYPIKKHKMWIAKPEMQAIMRDYVASIADLFKGRDVWYRTIELPTNRVNVLSGCDHFVEEAMDTSVGLRGIRRALQFPETFMTELRVISEVAETRPNLNIIFPFVHDISEFRRAKSYLKQTKFKGKIGMMAEIPSTVLLLDEFLKDGVDCITIGLNDLTSFTLAAERKLPIYNNTHPAVFSLMKLAMEKAKPFEVEMVVAGKHNKGSVENAEKLGFDAVTVFIPDMKDALGNRRLLRGESQMSNLPEQRPYALNGA